MDKLCQAASVYCSLKGDGHFLHWQSSQNTQIIVSENNRIIPYTK